MIDQSDITSIILYILLWIIALYTVLRKFGKVYNATIVLYSSYLIYSILALSLYIHSGYYKNITIFPFIYLFLMLVLGASPVLAFERRNHGGIIPLSERFFKYLLIFYIGISILRIPEIITSLSDGINTLMLSAEGGSDLYLETRDNYVARDGAINNVIAIVYNFIGDIGMLIFFYYLTFEKKSKVVLAFLLFTIVIRLLDPLSHGQRTGVTLMLLTILSTYGLFRTFIHDKTNKILKYVIVAVFIIVAIPFMALTTSRFGESSGGTVGGMESYAGQAPLNFNMNALDDGGIRYGDRTCTEFKRLLGFNNVPIDINSRRAKYPNLKMDDDIFSTYVGDFAIDFGPFVAVFLFLLFSAIMIKLSNEQMNNVPFYKVIPVYYVSCVCMQGGMYLFPYAHIGNYKIIFMILLYFACKYDYQHNNVSSICQA